MAHIELLQVGCTGQEVIDAINALIAAHNDGENGSVVSYEDLADKPSINGVTLSGNKTHKQLLVSISGASDYDDFAATNATKSYADEATAEAVEAAQAAVQAELDNKLDKDLGNIEAVDAFHGDALVPIVTGNGIKKTTLSNVAAFAETRAAASRTELSAAVKEQLKVLPLTGDQNGRNATFACADGYTMSTSCLYLNGQLLTRGTDYTETSSYQIVMLTHIPVSTDVMIFMAVPLA